VATVLLEFIVNQKVKVEGLVLCGKLKTAYRLAVQVGKKKKKK
jgi:hypothetical protein